MLDKILLAVALVLPPQLAQAEEQFVPAFDLHGPQTAKGVVIWSHGLASWMQIDAALSKSPEYLTLLHDNGWDIIRYQRTWPSASDLERNAKHLAAEVDALKAQRYANVVLAGQSAGAMISLMAAGKTTNVHAVIALAPACCGVDRQSSQFNRNADMLVAAEDDIHSCRVMVAFWLNDPYDPDGRGRVAERTFAEHDVPHLVLDHPAGTDGHKWGNGKFFVDRFGKCLLDVVNEGPMPKQAECEGGAE
jgi:pimeloyl-ACP methyl ester carboxylesterase